MSQHIAATTESGRRTIGDILLSHGYVTEQQLDYAAEVQRETGKPLGQVLVEAGAITRLELASALAEQWSDSSDWMRTPHDPDAATSGSSLATPAAENGIALTAARHASDDGTLATRLTALEAAVQELLRSDVEVTTAPLEHALADLARRVTTWEPILAELERRTEASVDTDALEAHLTELAGQIDETLRRSAVGGATSGALQARIDELTASVGGALESLERTAGNTANDLVALAARVDQALAAASTADLEAALAELAARPTPDPTLAARLDERLETLAAQVATAADRGALEEIRASMAALTARPSESVELAGRIEDLSRRVDALIAEAGARVEGDVPEELRAALEELATRPPADAALAGRVEELAVRLAELPQASDLRALQETVETLATRPIADPGLSDRVWHLAERLDAIADTGAAGLDDLRSLVESLAARTAADPGIESTFEQLDDRLDETDALLERVTRQVDELAASPTAAPAELAAFRARLDDDAIATGERLAELVRRLEELERSVRDGESASRPGREVDEGVRTELAGRLAAVTAAAQALSAEQTRTSELWYAGRAALEARLDDLESRLTAGAAGIARSAAAPSAQGSVPHTIEQEVERVLMAVERLGLHLSEHDRALAELMSRRGPSRVEELAARLDELETYGFAAAAAPSANGTPAPVVSADTRDTRAELRLLTRQVSELEDTTRTDREKLLTQLERMASSIDWRIRRLESGESSG